MKKFSPQYGTFFPEDLTLKALPEDVIEVTDDDYFAAINRQPGETLVVTDGRVYVVAPRVRSALPEIAPVEKLKAFLAANPDVAEILV